MKGKKHPHRGHAITSETKAKISAALHALHPNTVHKLVHHTGRHLSAAARAKISVALKGKHHVKGSRPAARATAHRHGHGAAGERKPLIRNKRIHISRRKGLISSATHHSYKGRLKTTTRHHRHRPVLHRKARAHRVWRRRKK
jgi:hypothetical protein